MSQLCTREAVIRVAACGAGRSAAAAVACARRFATAASRRARTATSGFVSPRFLSPLRWCCSPSEASLFSNGDGIGDVCPCPERGDMSDDGVVDGNDIALFVERLLGG